MERQVVTVVEIDPHTFELDDPNNDSCPRVGPYTDPNKRKARSKADEAARRLNAAYRSNWPLWCEACSDVEVERLF